MRRFVLGHRGAVVVAAIVLLLAILVVLFFAGHGAVSGGSS